MRRLSLTAGGLKWAYRKAEPPADKGGKTPIEYLDDIGFLTLAGQDNDRQ